MVKEKFEITFAIDSPLSDFEAKEWAKEIRRDLVVRSWTDIVSVERVQDEHNNISAADYKEE